MEGVNVVVDAFGGSGLLSHVAKAVWPKAEVVYNDYDGYSERLGMIGVTNKVVEELRIVTVGLKYEERLSETKKEEVLEVLRRYREGGAVDWYTIGSNLLFGGRWALSYEDITKNGLYNMVITRQYCADGYLDGVNVVHEDYKALCGRYEGRKDVLLVLDPPYMNADVGMYGCYWGLKEYLDVLKVMRGMRYVFFTTGKSKLVELLQWLDENTNWKGVLDGATVMRRKNKVNYGSGYEDVMIVRG